VESRGQGGPGELSLCLVSVAHQRERAAADDLRRRIRDEESYQHFIDNAIEGFFRTTRKGRYLKANIALARIYGYETPEQLIDEVTDIATGLYADPLRRAEFIALLERDGKVHDFISKIRRRDGRTIWIAENARIVRDERGNFMYFEGTVEDITGQRQSEDAMRRALKEAEETARAKAAFLGAMSHELKTPLNAIIGFSDLMRQEVFGPLGEARYTAYVGHIHENGKLLLAMIGDVLDLTRAEAGLLALDDEEFALEDIIDVGLASLSSGGKELPQIDVDLAPDLPLLRADRRRFRQIITHLLSNAVKFTAASGRITIRAQREAGGVLTIRIADTGIGMAPDRIALAVQPFRQLDSRLSRRFEGVGVGLPLVNCLLRLHGATLDIESEQGQGTLVTIAVPFARLVEPHFAKSA
jgi:PAS domain S-box-containing protein